MVNRIATFSFTNSMIADNMRLQTRYADINTQISSGLKAQDYKGLSRDAQYLLSIESAADKLKAYNANANVVQASLNTQYETLGRMEEMANSMITALSSALAGNNATPNVTQSQAQNALNETAALLNLQIAGRYVFSGSDIDTKPVDLNDPAWGPQTSPSVVNSSYYQGNSTTATVQVSETLNLTHGTLASNPAFEQLLRAYNLAYNNPSNATALGEAFDLVKSAINGIANIRGNMSVQSNTLEKQMDQNEKDRDTLLGLQSTIKETDIPSASVMLTEIQTQMEASYASSVRILNLNLHDFL